MVHMHSPQPILKQKQSWTGDYLYVIERVLRISLLESTGELFRFELLTKLNLPSVEYFRDLEFCYGLKLENKHFHHPHQDVTTLGEVHESVLNNLGGKMYITCTHVRTSTTQSTFSS